VQVHDMKTKPAQAKARQDLPGLQGKELSARMKAHAARVQRLLAMHEGMMKGM
jgi:hypothetical protein